MSCRIHGPTDLDVLRSEADFIKELFDLKSVTGRLPDCKRRESLLSAISKILETPMEFFPDKNFPSQCPQCSLESSELLNDIQDQELAEKERLVRLHKADSFLEKAEEESLSHEVSRHARKPKEFKYK